jgi:ribosome-associated translation inhibitor RaiA
VTKVIEDLKGERSYVMSLIINTEHFSLSGKYRDSVEGILENLSPMLPDDASIRLFLKKAPHELLTAILQVHARGRDFVATKTGSDLEMLVSNVESQLRRRLFKFNHRRVQARKVPTPIPED